MAIKEPVFYNVDNAVGPGLANSKGDVQLVQFFLREIYSHSSVASEKPQGNMVVDGLFGPITAHWIVEFQKLVRKKGGDVHIDGRVDPAIGNRRAYSSISNTQYTIEHLNMTYRRRFMTRHDYLERSVLPGPLAGELAKSATVPVA